MARKEISALAVPSIRNAVRSSPSRGAAVHRRKALCYRANDVVRRYRLRNTPRIMRGGYSKMAADIASDISFFPHIKKDI